MTKRNNIQVVRDTQAQVQAQKREQEYIFDMFRKQYNMKKYRSAIQDSSHIVSYGIGRDFVILQLDNERVYRYTAKSAGKAFKEILELAKKDELDKVVESKELANLYEMYQL